MISVHAVPGWERFTPAESWKQNFPRGLDEAARSNENTTSALKLWETGQIRGVLDFAKANVVDEPEPEVVMV